MFVYALRPFEELIHQVEKEEKELEERIDALHRAEEKLATPDSLTRVLKPGGHFGSDEPEKTH